MFCFHPLILLFTYTYIFIYIYIYIYLHIIDGTNVTPKETSLAYTYIGGAALHTGI